ncbi:NUDIX domain-containing protein [Streptomyces sp. NPDC001205]
MTDISENSVISDGATEPVTLTTDAVVLRDDDHLLLIERDRAPFEGSWALPGGWVDAGETSRNAASRELDEETGVRFDPGGLVEVGVFDEPGRDPRGRFVTVAYLAYVPNDTTAVAGDDARTARWWPINALPPLAFDHAAIVDQALRMEELVPAQAEELPTSPHESVQRYIAARQAGDADTASRICREVSERFETRTTDGSELRDLFSANRAVPLASKEA